VAIFMNTFRKWEQNLLEQRSNYQFLRTFSSSEGCSGVPDLESRDRKETEFTKIFFCIFFSFQANAALVSLFLSTYSPIHHPQPFHQSRKFREIT
jgi:hypothetical protein